jgi:hypothetical protein
MDSTAIKQAFEKVETMEALDALYDSYCGKQ